MDVLKEGLVTQCCAELLKFALHIECLDIITVISVKYFHVQYDIQL